MRDADIRAPLVRQLVSAHDEETLIVDEFGLCEGDVRVDLAVINGTLTGYEIKSDSDTLERLPAQQCAYSKVLDAVTIVAGRKHIKGVLSIVPKWWCVHEAKLVAGRVAFSTVREGRPNPAVDPFALAQLLWRDEALHLIGKLGLAGGDSRKPRRQLWAILARNLSAAELGAHVRNQLKGRTNWRSAV
jgi:hypothetical protein